VQLLARNNHGSLNSIRVSTFQVQLVGTQGNIISLPADPNAARDGTPSLVYNGAVVVRSSDTRTDLSAAAGMLDYSLVFSWVTTSRTDQWAVIQLAGGGLYTLEGVQLVASSFAVSDPVKNFEVWVSTTTADDAAFSRVLQATVANDGALQTFLFPGGPVQARYVRYVPLDSYRASNSITTGYFGVVAQEAARVVGVSSQYNRDTWPVFALEDGANAIWRTRAGGVLNEWIKVRLSEPLPARVYGVRIHPEAGAGPRDFIIRVSTTTADNAAFSTVYSGTLTPDNRYQDFMFAEALDASYVQFLWVNGYSTSYIGIQKLQVLGAPPLNSALLGFSSQNQTFTPYQALDINPADAWATAFGQNTNQWLKLVLPRADAWVIDQVALEPVTFSAVETPRDFEVQVSTTTSEEAAFVTVLSATLRNDGTLQKFSFPPVEARYVRLLLKNNYGAASLINLKTFWVFSPQIGGLSTRFLDRSFSRDGSIASYAWDFGDGSVSTERDPAHTFAAPGVYSVTLTVTDTLGSTASRTLAYHALAAPQADFTFDPAAPAEGQQIQFTDRSSDTLGIAYREWDWDDRGLKTRQNAAPTYTFNDNRTYNVTLSVANTRGILTSISRAVPVSNVAPLVNVGRDRAVLGGKLLTFAVSISDPAFFDTRTCQWDFGDGSPASTNCGGFSHTYPTIPLDAPSEVYTATLTVTDDDGGVGSDSLRITVGAKYDVLLLGTTVGGGLNSREVQEAEALGLVPEVVDAPAWAAKTTADFARYRTIILGDPVPISCGDGWRYPIAPAEANVSVWGPAITGNVLIMGSDPTRHANSGGSKLISRGIAFTADEPGKTGIFIALGCYYHFSPSGTPVPLLDAINPGGFTVRGFDGSNDAHIVATHPALRDLTDADLSNWNFSIHEGFETWPDDFQVLAIVRGIGDDYTAADGTTGIPYILARAPGLEVLSDIRLAPATASLIVGDSHSLTATVVIGGTPIASTPVTFTVVSGPHIGTTGTGTTDSSGIATFTYTGTLTGADRIEAKFTDPMGRTQTSNRVSVDWLSALPDLAVTKDNGRTTVAAGDSLTYTITVNNAGAEQATGVTLTDTLPTGTTFVEASDGGNASGSVVTWPTFTLAGGTSVTRTVTVQVGDPLPVGMDTLTNTVTVTDDGSSGPDPTPDNNTAVDVDSVVNTPTPTPTATPTATQTATDTPTPTATQTATDTPTPTTTPSPTASYTPTPSDTPTPTATETPTPTDTPTSTATDTSTPTATPTATDTPTPTTTPSSTPTATQTPTATPMPACELYPIALHANSLEGVAVGDIIQDIFNGAQPGNFGWLTWTGDNSIPSLVTSLTPPGDSNTYINARNLDDHTVSIGDWVQGRPGVANAILVRDALDRLRTIDIMVPVWDEVEGSGANTQYHVSNFALVRLSEYQLPGENRITVRFLGYAVCNGNNKPSVVLLQNFHDRVAHMLFQYTVNLLEVLRW
jgi:uncharacterized repeat protein (TIGR01451 family)